MFKVSLLATTILLASAPAAFADDPSWIMDTSDIGKSNGVIRSDQILELGQPTASALQLEGESAMRLGNLDRAIMILQRAVEMAPLDMDKRILYASALEKKLIAQRKRDPALFNFIVKQWLFVTKKSEFPDQALQGRSHLVNLTGRLPRMFEKTDKYLAQVLMAEDGSEKVILGKPRVAGEPGQIK